MELYTRQMWRERTRGGDEFFEKDFGAETDEEAVRIAQETANRLDSQNPFVSMGLSRVFRIGAGRRILIFGKPE